mgnify:FL=1
MAAYSKEEVRRIIAGLATGKPAKYRPSMSDAEFQARYDPPSRQETAMMELTKAIKDLITMLEIQQTQRQPYQTFSPSNDRGPKGPIPL